MISITGIRLTSFLCFRGEQEVALEPGVYAVTAERDGDPRRSNFQGKSSFLWAIRFALTGDHPKQTEDEWITVGEPEGGVDLELSDGAFISRTRVRGASTKLKVIVTDSGGTELEMRDADAQGVLDRIVGGDPREQLATWWCEQKKADRFLTAESSELTRDVVAWTGLERVQEACASVAERLREKQGERDTIVGTAVQLETEIAQRLQTAGGEDHLATAVTAAAARVAELKSRAEKNAGVRKSIVEREALKRDADDYERQKVQLAGIERELSEAPVVDEAKMKAARAAYGKANEKNQAAVADLKAKRALARGAFDGKCPIGGCPCPIKDELNQDSAKNGQAAVDAAAAEIGARAVFDAASTTLKLLERQQAVRPEIEKRLQQTQVRIDQLGPNRNRYRKLDDAPKAEADDVPRLLQEAEQEHRRLENLVSWVADLRRRVVLYREQAAKLEPAIVAHREGLAILGPAGAQRRVAEGMLTEVEDGANEMLNESGVELQVAIAWQRELKDLADACAGCGEPFPSSKKVKVCQTCGAARGNKLERKLRARVHPRSGGADDVGGVAIRMAANAWLRERRQAQWSVACLDEPFAALDHHNRHAVARHLVALLGGRYGVEQAFITAHDGALLAGLPRRIVVRGSERGSIVEVVG